MCKGITSLLGSQCARHQGSSMINEHKAIQAFEAPSPEETDATVNCDSQRLQCTRQCRHTATLRAPKLQSLMDSASSIIALQGPYAWCIYCLPRQLQTPRHSYLTTVHRKMKAFSVSICSLNCWPWKTLIYCATQSFHDPYVLATADFEIPNVCITGF